MSQARWKRVRAVLAVGLCSGWLMASPAHAKHGAAKDAKSHAEWLNRKLKLTEEQRAQVEQIMQDHQARMQPLHDQLAALKAEKHDKIRAVLAPEQQEKFDRWHDKKSKHHTGWRKPAPTG